MPARARTPRRAPDARRPGAPVRRSLPPLLMLDAALWPTTRQAGRRPPLGVRRGRTSACCRWCWRARLGFFALAPLLTARRSCSSCCALEPGNTVVAIPPGALSELARWSATGAQTLIAAPSRCRRACSCSVLPFADSGAELVSVALRNLAFCELALAVGVRHAAQPRGDERERGRARGGGAAPARRGAAADRARGARRGRARDGRDQRAGRRRGAPDRRRTRSRRARRCATIKRTSGDALTDLRATLGVLRGDDDGGAGRAARPGSDDLDERRGAAAGGGRRGDGRRRRRSAGAGAGARGGLPDRAGVADQRAAPRAGAARVGRRARATADRLTIEVADDGAGGGGRRRRRAAGCAGCASGRRRWAGRSTPGPARGRRLARGGRALPSEPRRDPRRCSPTTRRSCAPGFSALLDAAGRHRGRRRGRRRRGGGGARRRRARPTSC